MSGVSRGVVVTVGDRETRTQRKMFGRGMGQEAGRDIKGWVPISNSDNSSTGGLFVARVGFGCNFSLNLHNSIGKTPHKT